MLANLLLYIALALLAGSGLTYGWVKLKRRRARVISEEQRIEAARDKKLMEGLMAHPGWEFLVSAAKNQANERKNQVLLQPTTDAFAQEYMKGEIQGLSLFVEIPKRVLENAKAILEIAAKDETGD